MSVRYSSFGDTEDPSSVPLTGARGELYSVSIVADPRDLEDLLDRLGESRYPIDPQIYHDALVEGCAVTLVEFPAYHGWLEEIRKLLDGREAVTIRKCLTLAAPNRDSTLRPLPASNGGPSPPPT